MNPLDEIFKLFPNANVVCASNVSLDFFRRQGIFLNEPFSPLNDLTEQELVNCTFTVYQDGKMLIRKENNILACSSGLQTLPKGFGVYFDHGNNTYSDEPCKEPVKVTSRLTDVNTIKSILPYLQAIPKFVG